MFGNPTYIRESEIPHAGEVQRYKASLICIRRSEVGMSLGALTPQRVIAGQ